jgi:hypothetical protein
MWDNDKTLTFHGKPRSMYRFGEPDQFIEFNETLTTTVAGGALKLSYEFVLFSFFSFSLLALIFSLHPKDPQLDTYRLQPQLLDD